MRAFFAVLWSFFGIRSKRHLEADAKKLKPHQVITAGLLLVFSFAVAVAFLVSFITRSQY